MLIFSKQKTVIEAFLVTLRITLTLCMGYCCSINCTYQIFGVPIQKYTFLLQSTLRCFNIGKLLKICLIHEKLKLACSRRCNLCSQDRKRVFSVAESELVSIDILIFFGNDQIRLFNNSTFHPNRKRLVQDQSAQGCGYLFSNCSIIL